MIDTANLHDVDVWKVIKPEHLWVYNKLQIAKMQDLVCGPAGVSVPVKNEYIIRPMMNFSGMSIGAKIQEIDLGYNSIEPGMFWCEVLKGIQKSTTYLHGTPTSTYLAVRDPGNDLYKFTKWIKCNNHPVFPKFLWTLLHEYSTINVEFIGNKVIEVHLRGSPDPQYDELIPVWKSDNLDLTKHGYEFVEYYDDGDGYLEDPRLGFFVR